MICIEDNDMSVWEMPIATDKSGEVLPVICHQQSDANATTDQATIMCEASDGSGNKVGCNFQVDIQGGQCSVIVSTSSSPNDT